MIAFLLFLAAAQPIPDIQGTWTNGFATPLERPRDLGDKAFYTEAEVTGDLAKFNEKEKALEEKGLKIKRNYEINNGLSTTRFSWDLDFANEYSRKHGTASSEEFGKDATAALNDYIAEGDRMLKKYDQPFNIKNENGDVAPKKVVDTVKLEIKTKLELAHKTLDNLNQSR